MSRSMRESVAQAPVRSPGLRIPLIRPNPPRLSAMGDDLSEIERSGIYSNYGPVNARLEERLAASIFGNGACVTVANATLGLMLAIKQAVGWRPRGRYALMPSFTFAATAQAAMWCGLTPLLCDVDPQTWLPDAAEEAALLAQWQDEIAVIVPNATFGNCLDLERYDRLSAQWGVPVVIDAAASLGSIDAAGRAFGSRSRHPLVFSMHATKAFATAEAGLVYCTDQRLIAMLRAMGNFGFGQERAATMPGLNAKLSEVGALLALSKLREIEEIAGHRNALFDIYRALLSGFTFQRMTGQRTAHQFVSVLIPEHASGDVAGVVARLAQSGIGSGRYFVPHLAEQPYFRENAVFGALPVTAALSARVVSLPMSDFMTRRDVEEVCDGFRLACAAPVTRQARRATR